MNSRTSDFLNASRWVAAFFVVFFHVFKISVDYSSVVDRSLLLRGLHFLSEFGHAAVIVFFVISGFLVGGRTILRFRDDGFHVLNYSINRFSQIYTVLIPALIIGFTLDKLGIELFNASGIYNHPDLFYTNWFGNDITQHLSFNTFVGNLLQLQTITVSVLGSNGPLWSLANEWWYYVLFALCMIGYRSRRMIVRVGAAAAIVAMVMVLPLTISLWFVLWGIGAGVAVLDRYWRGWPFLAGATIAVVCLIVFQWMSPRLAHPRVATDFALDLVVALGYSAVLVCAKNLKQPLKFRLQHRLLANFSYTVYLVHFPALLFIASFMKDYLGIGFERQANIATMIYGGALLLMVYGYAWIFAAFTEAHTNAVRSRLSLVIPALAYRATVLVRTKTL